MGVLPLQFLEGQNRESLGLTGFETFAIEGILQAVDSNGKAKARVTASHDSKSKTFEAIVRIDTPQESEYYRSGGILPYVLRQLATTAG
jgi:aconitate hydratase